jgi:hypothetical protein
VRIVNVKVKGYRSLADIDLDREVRVRATGEPDQLEDATERPA